MSLKSETVDWIFARMAVRYGAAWVAKWDGVPMDLVATDWARELDRMPMDALVYAMNYLPADFPPTVTHFRELCIRAPMRSQSPPALSAPQPDPERVRRLVAEAQERLVGSDRHPKQWAFDLKAREESGERLSMLQREVWRQAIAADDEPNVGYSTPISIIENDQLPPGMRR